MKWYISLGDMLFAHPHNPNNSEHEAEEKIKGLSKIHNRGWDAFRVFQARDVEHARAQVAKWQSGK